MCKKIIKLLFFLLLPSNLCDPVDKDEVEDPVDDGGDGHDKVDDDHGVSVGVGGRDHGHAVDKGQAGGYLKFDHSPMTDAPSEVGF